jgi:hypothetical protein
VPLFGTDSVKELKNQAEFVGGLFGQARLGQVSDADVQDVIDSPEFRQRLCAAYNAAVADVGHAKALKKAVSAARINAEAYARLGRQHQGDVQDQAERAILKMLAH